MMVARGIDADVECAGQIFQRPTLPKARQVKVNIHLISYRPCKNATSIYDCIYPKEKSQLTMD